MNRQKTCIICNKTFIPKNRQLKRKICYEDHHFNCIICRKDFIDNKLQSSHKFCSKECRNKSRSIKVKKTNIERYGTTSTAGLDSVRKKYEETCLKKYGYKNSFLAKDEYGNFKRNKKIEVKKKQIHDKSMHTRRINRFGDNVTKFLEDDDYAISLYNSFCHKPTYKEIKDKLSCDSQEIARRCRNLNLDIDVNMSNPEREFSEILDKLNIKYDKQFSLGKYYYDFKIDDTLIEINPTGTHNVDYSPFGFSLKEKDYHKDKSDFAIENGYKCIHVFDWDDYEKIAKSFEKKKRIFARKCNVKEISTKDAKSFIDKYHFQNYANSSIKLGLFYHDELVEVMTFGKPRFTKKYDYELIRLCSKNDIVIVGGASKIFSYFINLYNPNSIVSYQDKSKFSGNIYEILNFKYSHFSGLNYKWCKNYNIKSRYQTQMRDEIATMKKQGYVRVFDCGNDVWVWNK